ncbi:MAG: RNA polymerase sigma-70 factor [Bacteroidales bacterium]
MSKERVEKEDFENMFKKYYLRLKTYSLRFVRDESVAEDIVQECFMKIWSNRDQLSVNAISPYLYMAIRNACLNHLKHEAVLEMKSLDSLCSAKGSEHLYEYDFCESYHLPLLSEELEEQFRFVVGQLPPRCKEVFLLSRLERKKNREIAEMLDISLTAVEKHIAKALQAFAHHFKHNYPIEIYVLLFMVHLAS